MVQRQMDTSVIWIENGSIWKLTFILNFTSIIFSFAFEIGIDSVIIIHPLSSVVPPMKLSFKNFFLVRLLQWQWRWIALSLLYFCLILFWNEKQEKKNYVKNSFPNKLNQLLAHITCMCRKAFLNDWIRRKSNI